ncbi:ABC transporter substrate-binding protein [Paludifilum halophilum]|uniref:Fe/B12 periplasmic-binding domain-containing protein n=1 Tax=Paludifilum halophilum TaxID=1642702 RepID=A0A235B695_9BACL|nr:ABC transporter substrate-binding protein [Paludifilum halophilum]OYD07499.1 hypothetical protein CHM34_11415 [Paludifilum halophilum]
MKNRSTILAGLTALLLVFGGVACSGAPDAAPKSGTKADDSAGSYPVEIKDDTGIEVTVKEEPKRIVSLIPSMTEIVYALDRGDRVVGVTTNDDYPKEVEKVEKVGDMKVNAEKVVSLEPDLVLASPMNGEDTIEKLRDLGLTVIAFEPQNLKAVYEKIRQVGKAIHAEEEAEKTVKEMKEEQKLAEKIASQVPEDEQVKVWLEVSPDLHTGGDGTFMDQLITMAGGENVAGKEKDWVQVSEEKVVQWNPDVILFTHGDRESIQSRSGWNKVNALKEERVEALDTNRVSRPGPRITQGLLNISKALYPDHYKKVMQ